MYILYIFSFLQNTYLSSLVVCISSLLATMLSKCFLGLIRCYKIMEKVMYTSDFFFFSLRNDDVKTVTFT